MNGEKTGGREEGRKEEKEGRREGGGEAQRKGGDQRKEEGGKETKLHHIPQDARKSANKKDP